MSSPPNHAAKLDELVNTRKLPIDKTFSCANDLSETKEIPATEKLSTDMNSVDDTDTCIAGNLSDNKTAANREDGAELPPLLRLPAELRNEIYSYIFPPPPAELLEPHVPLDMIVETTSLDRRETMIAPILHASQQLRSEASAYFFGTSIFLFYSAKKMVGYLKTLPRPFVDMIQHIHYDTRLSYIDCGPMQTSMGFFDEKDLDLEGLKRELAHAGVAALRDGVIKVWVVLGKKVKRESGLWTEDGLWTARPGEY